MYRNFVLKLICKYMHVHAYICNVAMYVCAVLEWSKEF